MIKHEHIHIFKTNIKTPADKQKLQPILGAHQHINEWSVDMDDVDCVLRVISPTLNRENIIELVCMQGYQCSEL